MHVNQLYTVIYTDLDNDTPANNPAYIKIFLDEDTTGFAMFLDLFAPLQYRDGNYSNGERYTFTSNFLSYGTHSFQIKCFDGLDINSTAIINEPLVWYPQRFNKITNQNAIEDIDYVEYALSTTEALRMVNEYIEILNNYNQTVIRLKYVLDIE